MKPDLSHQHPGHYLIFQQVRTYVTLMFTTRTLLFIKAVIYVTRCSYHAALSA